MGQGAVVGEQQQTLGVLVQTAHGEEAGFLQVRRQEGEDGGVPGVLGGGDHPRRLVEHEIGIAVRSQGTAVQSEQRLRRDLVLRPVGALSVYQDPSAFDQSLGLLPGPAACGGQQFIQTFHGPSLLFLGFSS